MRFPRRDRAPELGLHGRRNCTPPQICICLETADFHLPNPLIGMTDVPYPALRDLAVISPKVVAHVPVFRPPLKGTPPLTAVPPLGSHSILRSLQCGPTPLMSFPSWETPGNLLTLAVFCLAMVLERWREKMRNLAEIENPKA